MSELGQNLGTAVKMTKLGDYASAATADIESTVLDMSGYNGVLFLTTVAVADAANYIKIQQGDESDLSDAADLEGTKLVVTGTKEAVWMEIIRPEKRYLRVYVERGGSSTACGEIYAFQHGPRIKPVDNVTAGTLTGEIHATPAEGTA